MVNAYSIGARVNVEGIANENVFAVVDLHPRIRNRKGKVTVRCIEGPQVGWDFYAATATLQPATLAPIPNPAGIPGLESAGTAK